jgi:hypothetical protein
MRGYEPRPVTHAGQFRNVRSDDRTRYEIVAEHDGATYVVCYTARPTVSVLHGELWHHKTRVLDGAEQAVTHRAGRGRQSTFSANGWTFRYSGRTEREAIQAGEHRSI